MITVYVESNFVLELVLEQEEFKVCQKIIDLCSQRKIQLVLPAYSLIEPNEKLTRNARQRKQIYNTINQEFSQLKRTEFYKKEVEAIDTDLDYLLIKSETKEKESFQHIQKKLIDTAEIIPLNIEIIKKIREDNIEEYYSLSPQDALVFSSVIIHLENSQPEISYFLNKNSKDFSKNPDVVEIFKSFNCEILSTFKAGYNRVLSDLGRS